MPGWFVPPVWSAHVDALERHLDRMEQSTQRKGRQKENDAANPERTRRSEMKSSDQRIRDDQIRPALLYGVLGFCQRDRFRQAHMLADVASPRSGRHSVAIGADNNQRPKRIRRRYSTGQPAAMSSPTTFRATRGIKARSASHDAAHRRNRLRPLPC